MTGLANTAKGAADRAGAAIDDAMAFITASNKRLAAKELGAAAGRDRSSLESLLAQCDPSVPRSKEEQEWLDMAPVGREFGSPDYERLEQDDFEQMTSTLARLVSICSRATEAVPEALEFKEDTSNVQLVLRELGHDVDTDTAARIWKHYSNSFLAGWMHGANSIESAKMAILAYCRLGNLELPGPNYWKSLIDEGRM